MNISASSPYDTETDPIQAAKNWLARNPENNDPDRTYARILVQITLKGAIQDAEDKINHYNETRPLTVGSIKNTLTGEVIQPDPPLITRHGENK